MDFSTVLFLFLSTVAPVHSILHCSKCEHNCTRRSIKKLEEILFSNESSFIKGNTNRLLLAPWTYKTNENGTRLPESISTANCSHDYCRTHLLVGFNRHLHVLPIEYNIRVYFKELCSSQIHYRLVPGTFKVTVGCTCIKGA